MKRLSEGQSLSRTSIVNEDVRDGPKAGRDINMLRSSILMSRITYRAQRRRDSSDQDRSVKGVAMTDALPIMSFQNVIRHHGVVCIMCTAKKDSPSILVHWIIISCIDALVFVLLFFSIEKLHIRLIFPRGHMKCLGNGRLEISGQFQRRSDAFFRLVLSSQVTDDDVSDRYVLSGDLELGDTHDSMQQSHFAVVKLEQEQQHQRDSPEYPWKNYYAKARRILSFGCV